MRAFCIFRINIYFSRRAFGVGTSPTPFGHSTKIQSKQMEKKPQEKQQPRCVDSACGLVHSAVNLVGGGLARTASVGPRPPLQPANTNLWYVLNKRSFFSLLLLLIVVASIHYYYYCGHVLPIVLECSEQDRQQ